MSFEQKRKCLNEATKQRRLAIKEQWKTKSEDLRRNPRDFFKTFKPFLASLATGRIKFSSDIELNIEGDIIKDQIKITETLADYFCHYYRWYWRNRDAQLWNLNDLSNHPSVQLIKEKSRGCETFDFQELNPAQMKSVLVS